MHICLTSVKVFPSHVRSLFVGRSDNIPGGSCAYDVPPGKTANFLAFEERNEGRIPSAPFIDSTDLFALATGASRENGLSIPQPNDFRSLTWEPPFANMAAFF